MALSKKDLFLWLSLGFGITTIGTGGGALVTYFGFTQTREATVEYAYLSNLTPFNVGEINGYAGKDDAKYKEKIKEYALNNSKPNALPNSDYFPVANGDPSITDSTSITRDNRWDKNYYNKVGENVSTWMSESQLPPGGNPSTFTNPKEFGDDQYKRFIKVKVELGIGLNNAFELKSVEASWAYRSITTEDTDPTANKEYVNKRLWKEISSEINARIGKSASLVGYRDNYNKMTNTKGGTFSNIEEKTSLFNTSFKAVNELRTQIEQRRNVIKTRLEYQNIKLERDQNKKLEMMYDEITKVPVPNPLNVMYNNWGIYYSEKNWNQTHGGTKPVPGSIKQVRVLQEIQYLNYTDSGIAIPKGYEPTPKYINEIDRSSQILAKNKPFIDSQNEFMEQFKKTNTLYYVVLSLAGVAFVSLFCVLAFFITYTSKKNKEEYGDTEEEDYLLV